jgi:hypothetical protein
MFICHRTPPTGHGGSGGPGSPPVDKPPLQGAPAKPAWRTVTQRPLRKQKNRNPVALPAPAASLAPPHSHVGPTLRPDQKAQVTSWATWQRRVIGLSYLFINSLLNMLCQLIQ